jgi:hypothetical protein
VNPTATLPIKTEATSTRTDERIAPANVLLFILATNVAVFMAKSPLFNYCQDTTVFWPLWRDLVKTSS